MINPPATLNYKTRAIYEGWRMEPIPVLDNDKRTFQIGWSTRTSNDLWEEAEELGGYSNIAIRTGGGVTAFDCDCPYTVAVICDHLDSLGIDRSTYPQVCSQEPENRHIYIRVSDPPPSVDRISLLPDLVGDFRSGPGAYLVAPNSIVEGVLYRLASGSWYMLPEIEFADIAGLLGTPLKKGEVFESFYLPVPMLYREFPAAIWKLLRQTTVVEPGKPIGQYQSRSEAEMAILCKIALCGREYKDAVSIFKRMQPGHFADHAKKHTYLEHSWRKAIDYLSNDPLRVSLTEIYNQAQHLNWAHDSDRRVFSGIVSFCWQVCSVEVAASQRDLWLFSGVGSRNTLIRSLERLEYELGLIERIDRGDQTSTAIWRLSIT